MSALSSLMLQALNASVVSFSLNNVCLPFSLGLSVIGLVYDSGALNTLVSLYIYNSLLYGNDSRITLLSGTFPG